MEFLKQLLGGVLGGAIGALIWVSVVQTTGYEVGFVAWFVGILAGLGVAIASHRRGLESGVLAGAIALGSIGLGKVSNVWSEFDAYRAEALREEALVARLADDILDANVEAGHDYSDWYDSMEYEDSAELADWYPPDVWQGAERAWYLMSGVEQEQVRAEISAELDAGTAFALVIGTLVSLGLFDFVWVALAVSSAFKIASTTPNRAVQGLVVDSDASGVAVSQPAPAPAPDAEAGQPPHPMLRMGMRQAQPDPANKPMRRLCDPPEEQGDTSRAA